MRAEHALPAFLVKAMNDLLPHYHWLASASGLAELEAAHALRAAGVGDLKIGEDLRSRLSAEQAALVLTQLDLRQRAAAKFRRAGEMLFTRQGLEQSTSEPIAAYRAQRFAEFPRIVELCCGIGGDLTALAGLDADITIVDLDPVHLFLAEFNARVYQTTARITPLLMNVEDVALDSEDAVFIDPARREGSGKRSSNQSSPPVEWSVSLADRVAAVGIKTAPGIPRDMVPDCWELEMIALGSDLKEAVMWSPALGDGARRATVVSGSMAVSLAPVPGDPVSIRVPEPGDWLHDVNPAVTNAGLVEDLARELGAHRIDEEIGFLVSDGHIDHPMVSSWQILDVLPWHEKRIRQSIAAHGIGPIDIRRRGLPGDIPSITKRLRGKGNRRAIIAMTRVRNEPTAIICTLE